MKTKWYAAILGIAAVSGWCMWRAHLSSHNSSVPAAASDAAATQRHTAQQNAARAATLVETEATDRFIERLEAELMFLRAEPDPMRRDEKVDVWLHSIAFKDIATTLDLLQRQEQTEFMQDLQALLVRRGAATAPETAAEWAQRIPPGTARSAAITGVGVVWASQDLPAAARWASQLPEGEDREVGLSHVAYEAARTEPSFALKLTTDLAPTDARDELVRHAARQWAIEHPTQAVAWATTLPDPAFRELVLADIAASWGDTDPLAAADLASKSLSSGKSQEDALVGIAQQWVQREPERAAAWVMHFPQSFQTTALESVVRIWASIDAPHATKWVEKLPPGSLRDTALNIFAAK